MRISSWKIWYTGYRYFEAEGTIDQLKEAWNELPDDGFLVGMLYLDQFTDGGIQYRRQLNGSDWYFWWNDTILNNNNTDNEERYTECILKRGMWAPEDEFYAGLKMLLVREETICEDCGD